MSDASVKKKLSLSVVTIRGFTYHLWADISDDWNASEAITTEDKNKEVLFKINSEIYKSLQYKDDINILGFGAHFINLDEVFLLTLGNKILDGEV